MLVITRCRSQAFVIGDGDVWIRILSIDNQGEIKIGIAADKTIPIHREEIYEKIRRGEALKTANSLVVESAESEAS